MERHRSLYLTFYCISFRVNDSKVTNSSRQNRITNFLQKKELSCRQYEGNTESSEDDEEESEDDVHDNDLEWSHIGKSRNIQNHKPNLNPQNCSNKMMNYQPVDKLFNKYAGKINIDQYECSELKDLKLSDGDRYVF